MFGTVKRIIDWCGSFKKNLYIGFVFSFFSGWFAAMPVIWAAYIIGKLVECEGQGNAVSTVWIGKSIVILLFFIFLRFLFDYLRARFQESISYELIARDRLAVGDAVYTRQRSFSAWTMFEAATNLPKNMAAYAMNN